MKKPYRVYDLIGDTADFSLKVKDGELDVDLISAESARRYLKRKYGCFLFLDLYENSLSKEENIREAGTAFQVDFISWKTQFADNIQRMYDAISAKYSPIENYDRMEEGIITDAHHKGSKTSLARKEETTPAVTTTTTTTPNITTTTTNTPNVTTTTTNTPSAKIKNTEYTYGFDSTAEVPSSSTISELVSGDNQTVVANSGTDTSITSNAGSTTSITSNEGKNTVVAGAQDNYTETRDISDTVYDKDERTFNGYRVHGNIGVTESSSLVMHEVELRKINIAYIALDTFIREHCFYTDGIEVIENECYII